LVTAGIRELKQHTRELIRLVRREGRQIQITYRGEAAALLVLVERLERNEFIDSFANRNVLAAEIGAHYPTEIISVEAVSESRE
jgi:prevent-host-death family protein